MCTLVIVAHCVKNVFFITLYILFQLKFHLTSLSLLVFVLSY
jgi:hypothetical protein